MSIFFLLNSGLRFLLEMATIILIIIIAFSNYRLPLNLLIGIVLPIMLIILWGIFVAPKSPNRGSIVVRIAIETLFFGTCGSLIAINYPRKFAYAYLIFSVLNTLFSHLGESEWQW
jgi:hypothetical protein